VAYVILLAIIALVLFIYVLSGVKIVRPFQKGLVEQLGKYKETVEPGLRLIVPWFQSLRLVDMREQVVDVPPQEVITSDNVVVSVDAVIYYEPTEPQRLVYNVANFMLAVSKLAQTNLRNVVGDMQLDEALTSRDKINTELREILDDATDKWGVRVGRVEIQRIDPPPDVMHSMHEQMKAERTRRAVVTRAEGEQRSVILRAEGDKQQQILRAEGEAMAIQRVAEAEKFRQEVVAQGEAEAITSVYGAIHDAAPDTALLTIKYLDALTSMADGRATKIVVPTELAGIAGSLTAVADLLGGGGSNGSGDSGGELPPPESAAPQTTRRRVDRPAVVPPSTPPPDRT
jgi:regulator of protease activity HflC (stomatin/prohibitin superfamily)